DGHAPVPGIGTATRFRHAEKVPRQTRIAMEPRRGFILSYRPVRNAMTVRSQLSDAEALSGGLGLLARRHGPKSSVRRHADLSWARLLAPALAALAFALVPSQAAAQPAGFTMTDFDPERYSFRFVNNWNQSLYITAPIGGRVDLGS